ncbi:peptide deformylase [soil metagenome]
MILPIVKVPAKVLYTPVKKIDKITAKIKKLVRDMEETLAVQTDPEGVGLAAPQVGVGLALFIIRPDDAVPARAFINPKIIKIEESTSPTKKKNKTTLEGCLSVDRVWSPILRPQKVLLAYKTIEGQQVEEWFEKFDAVIVQHEVDHLDGILFTQRALEQQRIIYEERDGELEEVKF